MDGQEHQEDPTKKVTSTNEQRSILRSYYEDLHMISTKQHDLMSRCQEETGLPLAYIKNWIGNANAHQKGTRKGGSDYHPVGKPRRISGYNLFCSENKVPAEVRAQGMSAQNGWWPAEWNRLSASEREVYCSRAAALNKRDATEELVGDDFSHRKNYLLRKLASVCGELEEAGIHMAAFGVQETEENLSGCPLGLQFLTSRKIQTNRLCTQLRNYLHYAKLQQDNTGVVQEGGAIPQQQATQNTQRQAEDPAPLGQQSATTPAPAVAPGPLVPQPAVAPALLVPQPAVAPALLVPQPAAAPAPLVPQPAAAPGPLVPQPAVAPALLVPQPAVAPALLVPQPAVAPALLVPQPAAAPALLVPQPAAAPALLVPQPAAAPAPLVPQPAVAPAPLVQQLLVAPGPLVQQPAAAPTPLVQQPDVAPPLLVQQPTVDPASLFQQAVEMEYNLHQPVPQQTALQILEPMSNGAPTDSIDEALRAHLAGTIDSPGNIEDLLTSIKMASEDVNRASGQDSPMPSTASGFIKQSTVRKGARTRNRKRKADPLVGKEISHLWDVQDEEGRYGTQWYKGEILKRNGDIYKVKYEDLKTPLPLPVSSLKNSIKAETLIFL